IQKICNTKTERIAIPRRFEEVFVNGKKIESFEKHDRRQMDVQPLDMGWLSVMKKTNPLWVMK
ncbi:MAG: hypothetical protein WAZ77_24180, partial [Candidatus Nitrosopolaris sp.]